MAGPMDPSLYQTIQQLKIKKGTFLAKGFGVIVYEGLDSTLTSNNKPVAVKRINIENLSNEKDVMEKALKHENLAPYLTAEFTDDFAYFSMELFGGNLEHLFKRSRKELSPGDVIEVLRQITCGLHHLHVNKVVHGNLKPQNILISHLGEGRIAPKIKIADFGICKSTVSVETQRWRAPECQVPADVKIDMDYKADVFSLGCIFGYSLTKGDHPFGDENVQVFNIKKGIVCWKEGKRKISEPRLRELVERMISHEPINRPTTRTVLPLLPQSHTSVSCVSSSLGENPICRKIPNDGEHIGDVLASSGVKIYKAFVNQQPRTIKRIEKKLYATNYTKEIEILKRPELSACQFLFQFFTYEEDNKFCFLEMEKCSGSLNSLVNDKRLSTKFDGDIFMKKRVFQKNIIEGIAFLHDNVKLIHSDIKPSNILILEHGNILVPKITGYGISEMEVGKETEKFCGSDGWRAPELRAQTSYTKTVDVFAAGCLLFYIETEGGHPFSMLSSSNIGREAQRNIDKFNPNLTSLSCIEPTMLDLLCRALEREPEKRTAASEMLNHPVFYTYQQSLDYIRSLSKQARKEIIDKRFEKHLQDFKRVIIKDDWRAVLEEAVLEEAKFGSNRLTAIKKFRDPKFGKSVTNLLTLIADNYDHNGKVSGAARQIMGQLPNQYFHYWHKKFPHLLINTWNIYKVNQGHVSPRPIMLIEIQDLIFTQYEKSMAYRTSKKDFDKPAASSLKERLFGWIFRDNSQVVQIRPTSAIKKKKSFIDFLTDYSSSTNSSTELSKKQLHVTGDLEISKKRILLRLRHRIDLSVSEDNENNVVETVNAVKSSSAYDTLLELIDDYDPSGVCEIYHLLLETKFTVPLYTPLTNQHFLVLLKEIYANVAPHEPAIKLGEDTSLSRIVLLSCRKQTDSQSLELLKALFHLDSFHRNDLFYNTCTQEKFSIDLGIGYIGRKAQTSENQSDNLHVLVAHVSGYFENVIEFINEFADVVLIEDATSGDSDTFGSYFRNRKKHVMNAGEVVQILLWKPTTAGQVLLHNHEEVIRKHQFVHTRVSGQYGERLVIKLSSLLKELLKKRRLARRGLSQLNSFNIETSDFTEGIRKSDTTQKITKLVPKVTEIRGSLVLQQNYCEQAQHEEKKRECRLREDDLKIAEANVENCITKRIADASSVAKIGLVKYFLDELRNQEQKLRVMKLRQIEQALARLTDRELETQQAEINHLHAQLLKSGAHENNENARQIKGMYVQAKINYRDSMLHIEHLWRELSHLYVANHNLYADLPRLAAQHMLDGFSVELLDGDANLMNLPWIKAIFSELSQLMENRKRRIFCLSVMGVQSSGKSTLLNTMFGIKMRTSVGQCTRGINMQLLPAEGRPEYDYVLILDTEGTRSPEHYGMPGNEKRDNQMATLSILLADATIIVNPGENDAAVKEILPVVLMAYQSSKLAEDSCGRLSSMMFFVYNRIDTTQKERLSNIIQALSNSLMDAFQMVQQMTGCKPGDLIDPSAENANQLFRHFTLDVSNSAASDVRILGQNKKSFVPPENVPDSAYGETLVEFREHIHKRVTQHRGGVKWESHSPEQLSSYLESIWDCICSADFNLQFADVMERVAFDKLEAEYQKIERKLAWQYQKQFAELRRRMVREALITSSKDRMDSMGRSETCNTLQQTFETAMGNMISKLDKRLTPTISEKGRERWRPSYEQRWQLCKSKQEDFWRRQLRQSYDTIFSYNSQLENFKSSLRELIKNRFMAGLLRPSADELRNQFNELFGNFIADAEKVYPTIDVPESIEAFYAQSAIIRSHQIELSQPEYKMTCNKIISKLSMNQHQTNQTIRSTVLKEVKTFRSIQGKGQERQDSSNFHQQITTCLIKIRELITELLLNVQCYDEGVISELIEKTDVMLLQDSSLKRIDYSHRQMAHTFARLLLTSEMQQIQRRWDANNSIPAKLKRNTTIEAMWEYFQAVSRGANKITLFGLIVKDKISNLQESYKAEVAAIIVKRFGQQNFITSVSWLRYATEHYLIELLMKNKASEIVSLLQYPSELRTRAIYDGVAVMAKTATTQYKKWEQYVKDLKGAVKQATKTALDVKQNRASRFLRAMGECLGKSLVSDHLTQGFRTKLDTEYNEIDHEQPSKFHKEVEKVLIASIEKEKPPTDMEEFTKQITELAVENLQRSNGPISLCCDYCCPWCGSVCNLEAGHDVSQFKHDTVHQPAGLVGRELSTCVEGKMLEHRSCSGFGDNEFFQGKTMDNEDTSFHFRDWCTVFPDWEKPRLAQRNPLREYIFYHYHPDFAQHYGFNARANPPPNYNRSLNSIMNYFMGEANNSIC